MSARKLFCLACLLFGAAFQPRIALGLEDPVRDRILASQTRLATALLTRFLSDPSADAVMISPASLAGMLSSLTIAGDDVHRAAVADVLRLASSPTRLDDLAAIRSASVATHDEAVETATRYIFAPSSPPTAESARQLAQAGVEALVADPASAETRAADDAWVRRVTRGKITEVDPSPPGSALVAFNALYFKAGWQQRFSKSSTTPADFYAEGDDRLRVPFMHQPDLWSGGLREDPRFVAVDLSFEGGRYAMVVLTTKDAPAQFASFVDHLAWLDGQQFRPAAITLDIPRFGATSTADLLPGLVGLGLNPSDISAGLSARPSSLDGVNQAMRLNINEEGAEVAALTQAWFARGRMLPAVPPEVVVVDKPFAFALRDVRSGLMIAAGFVRRVEGEKLASDVPAISARSLPMLTVKPTAAISDRAIEQSRALRDTVDQMRKALSPKPGEIVH